MSYTQLTQEERYQIHALLQAGNNQTHIVRILNRHKSTISREIQRIQAYRPQQVIVTLTEPQSRYTLQSETPDSSVCYSSNYSPIVTTDRPSTDAHVR
jgi:IS30 family transposase